MWRILAALLVLALVTAGGIGWYYADEILTPVAPGPADYETGVVAVSRTRVRLTDSAAARQPGVWGLQGRDGYSRVGAITARDAGTVTRVLDHLERAPTAGGRAHVDGYAYPDDPSRGGLEGVVEVAIDGPLGAYPAWHAPADGDRWAVMVHGRGARRSECFRLLASFQRQGIASLCPTYRNDAGAPPSPDGLYHQGDTEWEDVAAAVDWAAQRGASEIVLVGYSMGAMVTGTYLRRAGNAALVSAVVWDAPLLDWGPVLEVAASDRGVPTDVVPLGMAVSELRVGIDYTELNQIVNADAFDVPILVFHGTADATVPVATSRAFARARPDLVELVAMEGIGHVESWNADPRAYERRVTAFLCERASLCPAPADG